MVAVDDSWYYYGSGVLSSTRTDINHGMHIFKINVIKNHFNFIQFTAVVAVGYDKTKHAWIVKNSYVHTIFLIIK